MEKKFSILYIDDESHNLNAFKASFRRYYEIFLATSAKEGRDILNEKQVGMVLSDQRMPETTGVEFFESITNDHPDPARVLITAFSDMQALIEAVNRARIDGYISKPWKEEDLRIQLENIYYEVSGQNRNENEKTLDVKEHKELEELLDQYHEVWEAWVSKSATLSAKEVLSIEYFRKYGSHKILAKELGIPVGSAYNTYKAAVRKLRSSMNVYNTWIVARAMDIRKQQESTNDIIKFLNTNINDLNLPNQTKSLLRTMGLKMPKDIVTKTTLEEMSKYRNFGQKKLDGIIALFREHNCSDMLK